MNDELMLLLERVCPEAMELLNAERQAKSKMFQQYAKRIEQLEAEITGHKLGESFLKDRIAELEALNASYNCDRERHHRLIDKLQAKLDAAKDGEAE